MSFPKDYFLFRSAKKHQFSTTSWFGDETTALVYNYKKNISSCKRYVANKKLLLIDITDRKTIKNMLSNRTLLSKDDFYVISYVTGIKYNKRTAKHKRITYNRIMIPDIMVFSPVGFFDKKDEAAGDYINKKFAKIVCKFGYDGWIIPADSVVDGTHGDYFSQEIMLCDPSKVLTRTDKDCKRVI